MKKIMLQVLSLVALLGLFSQNALAQDADAALKQISDIVGSLNHFPSDDDKAALAEVAADESLPQGVRDMAMVVANISHEASAEGKEMMASIQASEEASEGAKALAGVIAGLNHAASDEAKASLAQHYP